MPTSTERLRRSFKPSQVAVLLVGESPPEGGTFFFAGNSRLFASTKVAFERFLGERFDTPSAFLRRFKAMGFYLEDLCVRPVNGVTPQQRRAERLSGIPFLSKKLRNHRPTALIVVMKAIARPVEMALVAADLELAAEAILPFPAYHHAPAYEAALLAELKKLRRMGVVRAAR